MSGSDRQLVVVGGGFSGLVAGVAAQRSGIRTLICESSDVVGGASRYSRGTIWAMNARHLDANPSGRRELQSRVISSTADGREWLKSIGVEFFEEVDVVYGKGERTDISHCLSVLATEFERLGGEIRTGTRIVAADRRRGITELTAEDGSTSRADAVVLGTGGFASSAEFCARFGVPIKGIRPRSHAHARGDGLRISENAGGDITTDVMDTFYGHAMASTTRNAAPHEWFAISQIYGHLVTAIDAAGRRIRPSDGRAAFFSDDEINMAIGLHHGGRAVYLISASDLATPVRPGSITIADTLDELDRWGPRRIVAEDAATLSTSLAELGVGWDPAAGGELEYPLCAVPVQAGRTLTGGGVLVDESMRVLSAADGRPVWDGNLFCVGADVGGINCGIYIGGLSTALVTGLTAASALAHAHSG